MEKRRNNKGFEHLGGIIKKTMAEFKDIADNRLIKVWNIWEPVVGAVIAKNARPYAFKKKILLVYLTSSVWTQELQFMKKCIIEELNQKLGEDLVEEIKFKVGTL